MKKKIIATEVSIKEYRKVLSILCSLDVNTLQSISPLFVALFSSEKELCNFLSELSSAITIIQMEPVLQAKSILLREKITGLLSDTIHKESALFKPSNDEFFKFIKNQTTNEFTFLKIIMYALFSFIIDTPLVLPVTTKEGT